MLIKIKGGLISESFSLWLKSPRKKVPNLDPELYPPKEIVLRGFWRFEPK